MVTAGGRVFTATRDHKVRAYDVETGKVLWEKRLATGMQGIPSVYQADGREILVVCAAAPEMSDTASQGRIHGAYVAFALPGASKWAGDSPQRCRPQDWHGSSFNGYAGLSPAG